MKIYVNQDGPKPRLVIMRDDGTTKEISFRWGETMTWDDFIYVMEVLIPSE